VVISVKLDALSPFEAQQWFIVEPESLVRYPTLCSIIAMFDCELIPVYAAFPFPVNFEALH